MFCTEDILRDSVIEICPIIVIPGEQAREIVRGYVLYEYYFEWKKDSIAIALGYGSLYNHSEKPNAEFQAEYKNQHIIFIVLCQKHISYFVCLHLTLLKITTKI